MKKIICFTLALLLCLSSVCTAFASSSDSGFGGTGGSLGNDHGGTGGSIDWDKLQTCDDELLNKAKDTLNYMIFPDKAGVAAKLLSLLGSSDLDDNTKKYMDDNLKDNVKTDGTYFYYSPTYIQNINQKVQNRVHALNGYYLIDSLGSVNESTINYYYKMFNNNGSYIDRLSGSDYNKFLANLSNYSRCFVCSLGGSYTFFAIYNSAFKDDTYFCINNYGGISTYNSTSNSYVNGILYYTSAYTSLSSCGSTSPIVVLEYK